MRTSALALCAALALPAAAASPSRRRASRPARAAAHAAPAAPRAAAASAVPARETPADPTLFALGAELDQDRGGLDVLAVRPRSRAAELGLKAGDRLLTLDRRPVATRAAAAAAVRGWTPGSRLSAVVRRGGEVKVLQGDPAPRPAAFVRGAADLSARERAMAGERAAREAAAAASAVRAVPSPAFTARADQSIWVRFPKGLPASVKKGDVVEAEAATGLTTDGSLDFFSIPPMSRLWARVVESSSDGETRGVRLAFFKLSVAGGSTYPLMGAPAGVSGDQTLARVSAGGTLVTAAPLPDPSGSRPWPDLLDADARLRVRLLEPLALLEPPTYWRAGPGLWIKTAERDGKRLFEVSHITPGRSAQAAGLKVGDLLDAVDGKSTRNLDFSAALDRLYGAPGSKTSVSVLSGGRSRRVNLVRGSRVDKHTASPLPLPVNY